MTKINAIERSFLTIETPTTLQTIACLCPLEFLPTADQLKSALDETFPQMPRLKERLSRPELNRLGRISRRCRWETDPDFNINNHINSVHLLGINSQSELLGRAADLFYRPFDFNHPLWRFFLISSSPSAGSSAAQRLRPPDKTVSPAILLAVNHGYVDGLGGLEILNTVCTRAALHPARSASTASTKNRIGRPEADGQSPELPGAGLDQLPPAPPAAAAGQTAPAKRAAAPPEKGQRRSFLLPLRRMLQEVREPLVETAVNGTNSEQRGITLIDLPLDRLTKIKRSSGATVNDILLALITESLRRFSRERGAPLPDSVRIILPVSLRSRSDWHNLGNHVSAVGLRLPLAVSGQIDQLKIIRGETARIKSSEIAKAYALFAALTSFFPARIQRRICESQATKTGLICTNMNVSARPMFFCGAKILGIYPTAALMRRHGIAYGFVRYTDKICLGLVNDPAVVSRPERLAELMHEALGGLEQAVFGAEQIRGLSKNES